MSGDSISKKLEMFWRCPNREPHRCSLRHCPPRKKESRRLMHLKRKEIDNASNRKRYHEKYKLSPVWMEKRRASWKKYASKQTKEWFKKRACGRKNPKRSDLSPSRRFKLREAYTKWAVKHWKERVDYAKTYRRRSPVFGLRQKISRARESGDIRKLAEECFDAIIRADETGRKG